MQGFARFAILIVTAVLVGCAHQINITPPLNTLDSTDIIKIDKIVGYYISAADRTKQVTTAGGGGDKVKYLPYQESEPALKQILSNLFAEAVAISSLDDKQFLLNNKITYVFVPTIDTVSSSESVVTWPPTKFTLTLDCRAIDDTGGVVWQKKVHGEGRATFSEFKHDFALAARRASKEAFLSLQAEINGAKAFRQ